MPLPVKDVIRMMKDNILKKGSPIPISAKAAHAWTDGLNIPKGGNTILYTGLLYQLVPYIDSAYNQLSKLEKSGGSLIKIGRIVSKIVDVSKLFASPSEKDIKRQHTFLRNIAVTLRKVGVDFGYLYEEELYSGVLLYDFGLEEKFVEQAKKVYDKFKKHNVRNIITVDPHTTYMLKNVYPKYINDFRIEVKNYLEILAEKGFASANSLETSAVIHDPCFYARYGDIIEQPRLLLKNGEVDLREPERNGRLTFCCGGPIEAIFPRLSMEIAKSRINELAKYDDKVIVLCPICYANLNRMSHGKIKIHDISEFLIKIYG